MYPATAVRAGILIKKIKKNNIFLFFYAGGGRCSVFGNRQDCQLASGL